MNKPVRLAVLLSGSGRTLQNLIDRISDGSLAARIEVVISSKPQAYGLERARKAGLPAVTINRKDFPDDKAFSTAIMEALGQHAFDLVILAGFLHLLHIPEEWTRRVLNIHPALLPDFGGKGYYGKRVHEAVLRAGVKESGCTIHFCDNQYDHGQILLQKKVPVRPGDTPESLAERVFEAECLAYPEAIQLVAEGKA